MLNYTIKSSGMFPFSIPLPFMGNAGIFFLGGIDRKFVSKLIVMPFKTTFTDCLKKFRIKK